MLYITETTKDFETAVRDLEEVVKHHKYGVLHVHDLHPLVARGELEEGPGTVREDHRLDGSQNERRSTAFFQ